MPAPFLPHLRYLACQILSAARARLARRTRPVPLAADGGTTVNAMRRRPVCLIR